jgi:hypothetical protein
MTAPIPQRQAYALARPLSNSGDDSAPYTATRRHKTGLLLVSILAVDR